MKFISVFFIVTVICPFIYGQLSPWYQVEKIDSLEVSVFFAEDSVKIQPYYDFHLAKYVQLAKNDPLKKIVIVHRDLSSISTFRALRLRDFLIERLGFPRGKVDLNIGLPPSYLVSQGEKLLLFLKTDTDFKENTIKRSPAVSKDSELPKKQNYIYIKRSPTLERKALNVSLGIRDYNFSNTSEELFAWTINAQFKNRLSRHLNVSVDLGYTFSDSAFAEPKEYHGALGLESEFDFLNLNSKFYGRKNWAWVEGDSKFVTVNDLGLHQGLEFKLVRRPSYALTVGAWAELSLSNTISEFASANVLSFQTEITFEWFESATYLSLYKLSRRYEVFDGDIVGLNLGYKF